MQICSLHRLKKHTQVYAKIHFELEFRQYFWEKHVELVPLQVVEVIFQSKVSDFRVLKSWSFLELCSLLPTRDLPWTHKGASQHPPPLQISCWNWSSQKIFGYVTDKRAKWKTQDYQIFLRKIVFLDTVLCKCKKSNIQATLYTKPTDEQAFLHTKFECPRPLKYSILYSQALRLKTISSTTIEYNKHCAIIKQKFLGRQTKKKF